MNKCEMFILDKKVKMYFDIKFNKFITLKFLCYFCVHKSCKEIPLWDVPMSMFIMGNCSFLCAAFNMGEVVCRI